MNKPFSFTVLLFCLFGFELQNGIAQTNFFINGGDNQFGDSNVMNITQVVDDTVIRQFGVKMSIAYNGNWISNKFGVTQFLSATTNVILLSGTNTVYSYSSDTAAVVFYCQKMDIRRVSSNEVIIDYFCSASPMELPYNFKINDLTNYHTMIVGFLGLDGRYLSNPNVTLEHFGMIFYVNNQARFRYDYNGTVQLDLSKFMAKMSHKISTSTITARNFFYPIE